MRNRPSIFFLTVTAISLFVYIKYLSASFSFPARAVGFLGFFGLPVSFFWLGISLFIQGKKMQNRKNQSIGVGLIVIGLITSMIVVGWTILAFNDSY